MDKNTLEEALVIITAALSESDINSIDKVELMLNLNEFLNPEKYEKNIEILKENDETIRRR